MERIRSSIDLISEINGLPLMGTRIVVAQIACCFIAPLMHSFQNSTQRHLFGCIGGFLAAWFVFEHHILHSTGITLLAWIFLRTIPRNHVGHVNVTLTFGYLFCIHYYREYINPGIVWDCAQMVLTLKLSGLSLSYADGGIVDSKLKSKTQVQNQLLVLPSLLEVFGYVFFFPSFLAGPVFDFKNYLKWIDENRMAPLLAIGRNIFVVLLCIAGFLISSMIPVDQIDSKNFFPSFSFPIRMLLQCVAVMMYRFRFYMVWSLAETGSVLAGIGYVPETNQWDGVRNQNIYLVEFPTNMRVAINNWNMGVAKWLNIYVYQRVGLDKDGKPTGFSTFFSFFVSAIWHGFFPGYYMFFLTGGIYIEAAKLIRRNFRSHFHYKEDRKAHPYAVFLEYFDGSSHPLAAFYDIGGMLLTWIFLQYNGIAFELLVFNRIMKVWQSWYFMPHLISIAVVILLTLTSSSKKKKE